MTKRTDPHRPGAIVPAEYEYCFSYFPSISIGEDVLDSYNWDLVQDLVRDAKNGSAKLASTGGPSQCSSCGAHFIYGDVWLHKPTSEHVFFGHDCADKYGMLADRSAMELARDRRDEARAAVALKNLRREKMAKFIEEKGLAADLEAAKDHYIVRDMLDRLGRYGSLSDKQVALIKKLADEARKPDAAPEKNVPAPVGDKRVTFDGTIVSAKYVAGYGYNAPDVLKVTVKVETADGVWLAWGTCPASIAETCDNPNGVKGLRVRVTAKLEAGRDPHFAFMKRPSAVLLHPVCHYRGEYTYGQE